jgi:uncharacterized membrane protein
MRGKSSERLVFVDQARALAITMMLIGHSLDRFLGEPWRSGAAYDNYKFVRGLSSALFLFIAGFSFVIASFGRIEEYTHLSNRLKARLRRIGFILFLGILLQLPATTLQGSLQVTDTAAWERFFSFNVLQTIGLSLFLLHVVLWFARTPRRFGVTVAVVTTAIFLLAHLTYSPAVDAVLPMWCRGAVNLYHQSRFPMVPFAAFIFMGAVLGTAFWTWGRNGSTAVFRFAAGAAGALIAFELVIRHLIPGGIFPYSSGLPRTAGNTFARAGFAMLIVSALYFLSRRRVVLSKLALVLSKDSLAIYFTHLFLVYGGAATGGLFSARATAMTPIQVALFIAGLFVTMTALALALRYLRRHHAALLTATRRSLVLAMVLSFAALPYLLWQGIGVSLVVSVAAVLVVTRYRRPPAQKRSMA